MFKFFKCRTCCFIEREFTKNAVKNRGEKFTHLKVPFWDHHSHLHTVTRYFNFSFRYFFIKKHLIFLFIVLPCAIFSFLSHLSSCFGRITVLSSTASVKQLSSVFFYSILHPPSTVSSIVLIT